VSSALTSAPLLPPALAAEYPFDAHWLDLDAGRLHYVDEGPREASLRAQPTECAGPVQGGPRAAQPVLFLHGNPTWSFLWRHLVSALRGEFRCVAPDHLGCGLSDKPAAWRYDLTGHAENALALVEHLDLRGITLVAHDWGGAIGMALVRRAPDRFARLMVMNTAAFPGRMPLRIAVCRTPALGPFLVERMNAFAGLLPRFGVAQPARLSAAARDGYAFPYRSARDRHAIRRFVEDIPTSPAHPSWSELENAAAAIVHFAHRPAAIVWGERDWCFTPRFREEWQSRLPRAAVLPIAHAGHLVPEEAPREVEGALRELLARSAGA